VRPAAHRRKILAEKDSVIEQQDEKQPLSTQSSVEKDGIGSPTLFSQSPPMNEPPYLTRHVARQISQGSGGLGSQDSTCSTGPSLSFEVVSIQMKKKISSSSNDSQ